ncbi:MAG: RIP metalloprotease RseP [SAR86 cluster bacterium]|jgi:regulator of sigma E protease|uniref:Zinc metalloprotease n=1 Tax=SAR86 cluster bacterium TaxID=2030880 RepID=A0A520N5B5_9GAMM|nr:MAG: RIP metalloprotease RseP [SAR86 cluster bacterium]|tara:strand:- start:4312 stop:5664 length:1353 start_codon:yes stop_codon:yes gene_type:complete
MTYLIYILAFLVLLGVLVTIHEFGHFIVARMCKVHVQRFSIGMGPVFYKKLDKHGTEFALSAIPLGGYVSMITNKLIELEPEISNQLTEEQLKNTFDSKPKWQRASIMFAGPLANFLLSIFIFTGIFLNTADPKIVPVVNSANQQITYSSDESFEINDQILSINNTSVKEAKDVNLELLTYAGYTGDLSFEVARDGLENSINILVKVSNFLPTSESQSNPTEYLGVDISYLMQPIIGKVIPSGSADNAGIKSNDRILKIGDANINFASDIQKQVSENPNNNVEFKIERDGKIIYLPVDIGSQSREDKIVGMLGVSFGTSRGLYQSLLKGVYETYNLSVKTLQFIGKMISGNMGTENLSGPIGIAQMAGDTAQAGFLPFMYLMALLSISLAVLNLLPIPVLDGGQLTLLGIEAIRGKPLPEKAENIIYTGGAAIVVMLMVFAIFNDISRFL